MCSFNNDGRHMVGKREETRQGAAEGAGTGSGQARHVLGEGVFSQASKFTMGFVCCACACACVCVCVRVLFIVVVAVFSIYSNMSVHV